MRPNMVVGMIFHFKNRLYEIISRETFCEAVGGLNPDEETGKTFLKNLFSDSLYVCSDDSSCILDGAKIIACPRHACLASKDIDDWKHLN